MLTAVMKSGSRGLGDGAPYRGDKLRHITTLYLKINEGNE